MNAHTTNHPAEVTPEHAYIVWSESRRLGWFPTGHAHATLSDAANDLIGSIDEGKWSFPTAFQVQLISHGTVYDMTAAAVCAIASWIDAREGDAWLGENEDHPLAEWLRNHGTSWADAAKRGAAMIDADTTTVSDLADDTRNAHQDAM